MAPVPAYLRRISENASIWIIFENELKFVAIAKSFLAANLAKHCYYIAVNDLFICLLDNMQY